MGSSDSEEGSDVSIIMSERCAVCVTFIDVNTHRLMVKKITLDTDDSWCHERHVYLDR